MVVVTVGRSEEHQQPRPGWNRNYRDFHVECRGTAETEQGRVVPKCLFDRCRDQIEVGLNCGELVRLGEQLPGKVADQVRSGLVPGEDESRKLTGGLFDAERV